jgi:hypothetical protein
MPRYHVCGDLTAKAIRPDLHGLRPSTTQVLEVTTGRAPMVIAPMVIKKQGGVVASSAA